MQKKITAIFVALCLVCMLAPTAFAGVGDTTPPRLISVSVDKTSYVSGESVTVTVEAVDDESGVDFGSNTWVRFTNKHKYNTAQYIDIHLHAIDAKNIFEGNVPVNEQLGSGEYYISDISLGDMSGNRAWYYNSTQNSEELKHFISPEFTVTNTVRTDWDAPTVSSITCDKSSVNVGEAITFEATAEDATGIWMIIAYIYYLPDANINPKPDGIRLDPVEGHPGLVRGTFVPTDVCPDGTYGIECLATYDTAGNLGGTVNASTKALRFTVHNPDSNLNLPPPVVRSITLNQSTYKPGDNLEIIIDIDAKGNKLNDYLYVMLTKEKWRDTDSDMFLYRGSDGKYHWNGTVRAYLQPDTYGLDVLLIHTNGKRTGYTRQCGDYIFPKINITSVFNGTENQSLLTGTAFDPMEGVSASNQTEGDMTDRIQVTGSVNTQKPGLYLLRYQIKSNQYMNYNDSIEYYYYYESRWIGVSELPVSSPDPGTPLALTNDTLAIGVSSSEATIQKDGKSITFASQVTDPGEYTVSLKDGAGTSGYGASYGATGDNSDTAKAVIDRSGPQINATSKLVATIYKVLVDAKDPSGVAETKYMPGSASLDNCKTYGTAFSGSFTIGAKGKYTIYARDGFGYESIKVIDISKVLVSNPYLNNIKVDKSNLTRTFSYNYYNYTVNIGENDGGLTITPEKADPDATMTIQGETTASKYIHVDIGRSVKVPIKIKSGKLNKTYYVTVKRAKSTNNELSGLNVSIGNDGLTYDAATQTYTLQLNKDTASVRVTPVKSSSLAKVSPGAKTYKVKNGKSLKVKIVVTAQSGARKVYWLIISRANS